MRRKITHNISEVSWKKYVGTHKIYIRIPWEKGWIEYVKFHIWKGNELQEFEMEFVRNEDEYACFEIVADFTFCQFDYYYFTYKADSKLQYYRYVRGTYQWKSEYERILQFYQKVVNFCKNGDDLWAKDMRIIEISWEHVMVECYYGQNKAIIIVNRLGQEIDIAIPKEYDKARVIFATNETNFETLAPYSVIVLKG